MGYFSSYGRAGMNYSSHPAYSGLEQKVSDYAVSFQERSIPLFYSLSSGASSYGSRENNHYNQNHAVSYIFHDAFLNPLRPRTQFVNDAVQVKGFVEETFRKTTGEEMPNDFTIEILKEDDFRKFRQENGVLGFAVNRKGKGTSRIVIRENDLDMLMVVIGHEIGHVLTMQAITEQDEEAKAFSFQFAWAKAIFENDIAGLGNSINPGIFQPAQNGIHDIAFSFVQKLISSGRKSLEVYGLIAAGLVGINNWGLIDFS